MYQTSGSYSFYEICKLEILYTSAQKKSIDIITVHGAIAKEVRNNAFKPDADAIVFHHTLWLDTKWTYKYKLDNSSYKDILNKTSKMEFKFADSTYGFE